MIQQGPAQKTAGLPWGQGAGLTVIRVTTGIYVLVAGISKARWLLDSTPFADLLVAWSAHATPLSHWYLERITPGAPVFARLIPLGGIVGGAALTAGFWTRLVAGTLFLAVFNLQVAAGAMFSYAILTNAAGLPLLGVLLGLTLGGGRLPLSVRK
jgi:uncharacterized membrane protein YphA (DoxX/SURF4 family)